MKNILVTTDFSSCSWKAIPAARAFAELFHLEHPRVTLLSVGEFQTGAASNTDEPAASRLEYLRRQFLGGVDAQTAFVERNQSIAEAITDFARAHGVDLIVLASHGKSGVKRLLAGSVAERVLAFADCPVLVIPASEDLPEASDNYRIVVTTDLSPESEAAFPVAREIYRACGAQKGQLTVIHMLQDVTRATFGMTFGMSAQKICADVESTANECLSAMTMKHFPGLPVMSFVVRSELPRIPALLQYIACHNTDLIVTARHGASGLEHALFGSFTRALISSSHRNVLIVPSR